jgi:hypothetical protein
MIRFRLFLPLVLAVTASVSRAHAGNLESEDQLAEDLNAIPAGMGAILVPGLTRANDEPEVVVYHRGERIAAAATGTRIVLPPGTYHLVLGAEDPNSKDLPSTDVRVVAGKTELLKPFYGALRVNMVNENGEAVEGEYVLRSAERGTVYGPVTTETGRGAKPVPTWLLPPGKYVLVRGSNASATEGSVAIVVAEGEALKYRMVVDESRLVRTEFGDDPVQATKSIWRVRWLLGASGTASRRVGTFTGTIGDGLFVQAFSRFEGRLLASIPTAVKACRCVRSPMRSKASCSTICDLVASLAPTRARLAAPRS